jgi:two-component system, OmpR family, response regulator MprA
MSEPEIATSSQRTLSSAGQTAPMRVLLVDDDRAVRESIERALHLEGYEVDCVGAGLPAIERQRAEPADAVVLDLRLPDVDGLDVCRQLRAKGDRTPILMLTARDAIDERVEGLDAGADDYVVKPFALDELLARLRALLRRTENGADGSGREPEVLRYAHLSLDPGTREVRCGERSLELTRTEFALLELFLENPRQVLPRAVIFDRVWGYDFGPASNSLEVYIGYLRRKTEAGGEPRLLHTVRGIGYSLREP